MKILNLAGQTFGKLTVIDYNGVKAGHKLWRCLCACGKETITTTGRLRCGRVNSCGCLVAETNKKLRLGKPNYATSTHRATTSNKRTTEYVTWLSMRQRCLDKNHSNYKNYGAKGINVCSEWRDSFDVFLNDMGIKPTAKHSIDRINTNLGYEPGNCRWVDSKTQQNNRTNNRLVLIDGVLVTASAAAVQIGLHQRTFSNRLDRFDAGLITKDELLFKGKKNQKNQVTL